MCVLKIVDLGEELICLGHAVSYQDESSGLREGDEPRSLQKMLVRDHSITFSNIIIKMNCLGIQRDEMPKLRFHIETDIVKQTKQCK